MKQKCKRTNVWLWIHTSLWRPSRLHIFNSPTEQHRRKSELLTNPLHVIKSKYLKHLKLHVMCVSVYLLFRFAFLGSRSRLLPCQLQQWEFSVYTQIAIPSSILVTCFGSGVRIRNLVVGLEPMETTIRFEFLELWFLFRGFCNTFCLAVSV